jgi:hypothetical protein
MKTRHIILTMMSSLFMLFSAVGTVKATEEVEVNTIEASKKIRMELSAPVYFEINVTLYGSFSRVLYNDQIAPGATFEDEFDFSAVRNGTYRLVSQKGHMKYHRVFSVSDSGVEMTDSYYSFYPQFKQEGDLLRMQFINTAQSGVSVRIVDAWGEVFNDYYSDPGKVFSATYGLNRLPAGYYTLQFESDDVFYTHEFTVE